MARKPKTPRAPTWKIEAFNNGQWLWVLMPPYRTQEEAEASIAQMVARHPADVFRAVLA